MAECSTAFGATSAVDPLIEVATSTYYDHDDDLQASIDGHGVKVQPLAPDLRVSPVDLSRNLGQDDRDGELLRVAALPRVR